MSKNAIHNFNLSIKNSADIKSSEHLTEAIIKELAKVSKEINQQKDIEQLWQEQKALNTIANNSSTSIGEGATDITAEKSKKQLVSVSKTSSVSGGTPVNNIVSTGEGINGAPKLVGNTSSVAETTTSTSSASIGEGVADTTGGPIMSSAESVNTTSPGFGAGSNVLNFSNNTTTQTYANVEAQQTLMMPPMLHTNSGDPTIEAVKAEIKKKLNEANITNDTTEIAYWTNISKAFDEGATVQDFNGKKDHERFAKMYFGLQNWRLSAIGETTINNVNWGEASELMILKLLQLSKDDSEENLRDYYKRLIKEIKNPDVNIQQLFSEHDELFIVLKSVFPNLPDKITIQTKKVIYPNLSPQKMYPGIGAEEIYFVWSGTLLDNVEIKYGKGEIRKDKNGKYPNLKEGQWYDYDRINNPTKEGSTFWKASFYNTINGQHYFYHTIGQRHAYYQFVDAYLKTKGIISEWFDAAARVTMGSIKEALQGEIALGSAEMMNLWYLSDDTDEFLKGGNRYLFSDNMNNVKLLLEGKGKLNGDFIDAKGNKQSFKNLSQEELDLKLVEFEQTVVQDYINSSFKDLNSSLLKKSLEETSSETGNKEFDAIIKEINENFTHWMAPDIMQDIMEKYFTKDGKVIFNFAKYDDRVKLGQVMVKELYYLKLSDTFKVDNIDKILENPDKGNVRTEEYFIINQKNAVKEKPKHLKEYKLLERYERIRKNFNNKSSGLHEVAKVRDDIKRATAEEVKKSLKNILKEINNSLTIIENEVSDSAYAIDQIIYNDLRELYDEIKKEFETTRTNEPNDKEYVDLIESLYDDMTKINELSEKLRAKIVKEVGKTVDIAVKETKKLPDEIAVNALVKTAERICPGVGKFTDSNKEILFKKSYEATIAILLYEFAKGEGPEIRNFDYHEHKFAQALLKDRMIKEIMEETLKLLRQTNYDFVNRPDSKDLKLDLEFSPTSLTYAIEGIDKHLDSNLAQIFVGGTFALVRIKNKKLEGYIYNKTGRNSLMLHITDNIERKNIIDEKEVRLSTIIQRIYFTFKLP